MTEQILGVPVLAALGVKLVADGVVVLVYIVHNFILFPLIVRNIGISRGSDHTLWRSLPE